MDKNVNYDIVIPILSKDFDKFSLNVEAFRKYLPAGRFVLLGDEGLSKRIQEMDCDDILYINENSVLAADMVKSHLKARISGHDFGEKSPMSRFGWYYQQFLKLTYSFQCESEYYLVWDADTVPIKKYEPFDEQNRPYFDVKDEYHIPYFETLEKLSEGELKKVYDFSFISEHMVLKCEFVKEMIAFFAKDNSENVISAFCERVFGCIDDADLRKSGFSEFESYGSYCMKKHPGVYQIRVWKSLRDATSYFDHETFGEEEVKWLEAEYDAVSFEKFIEANKIYRKVCADSKIREKYSFAEAAAIASKRDKTWGLPGRFCEKVLRKIKRK